MHGYQLVEFGADLEACDRPTPEPKGSEVLLKVRAAGVCHSDLHICGGGYDLGGGRRLSLADRGVSLPRILGHETVGEVVAAGPDTKDVRPGDVRLIYPWIGCGECLNCQQENENLCTGAPAVLGVHRDGGFADHIMVPHERYLLDLKGIDPAVAAPLACSGLTTYNALTLVMDIAKREPIVLMGAGGLGLMCLGLLKAMGGKGAIVVDIDPDKRQAALDAGALAAIDGAAEDAADQIRAHLDGPLFAVIDFVGNPATATLGFDLLAKGGRLILLGLYGGASSWPLAMLPMKAATIQGCYVGNLRQLHELVDLVSGMEEPPLQINRRELPDANRVLSELEKGQILGRAVLIP